MQDQVKLNVSAGKTDVGKWIVSIRIGDQILDMSIQEAISFNKSLISVLHQVHNHIMEDNNDDKQESKE